MVRPLRVELAGGHYHVICRGIERRTVFRDQADHQKVVRVMSSVTVLPLLPNKMANVIQAIKKEMHDNGCP